VAGAGGGAWKVAYADFVTAMMAFFLVMWIVSQDQKKKDSIAHYFQNPAGYWRIGSSKEPGDTGAVLNGANKGPVPNAKSLSSGNGRDSLSDADKTASVTQSVAAWLTEENDNLDYWQSKAKEKKHKASVNLPLDAPQAEINRQAAEELSVEMKRQVKESIPPEIDGVYRNLLEDSINRVRWDQLAEDMLSHEE
jgi:chemotaxis protein MotB